MMAAGANATTNQPLFLQNPKSVLYCRRVSASHRRKIAIQTGCSILFAVRLATDGQSLEAIWLLLAHLLHYPKIDLLGHSIPVVRHCKSCKSRGGSNQASQIYF
jgi:hypothetical protein